jgi:hypothetical protein
VVIGVVHAIHSSSAASITQVHQFTGTAAVRPRPTHSGCIIPPPDGHLNAAESGG